MAVMTHLSVDCHKRTRRKTNKYHLNNGKKKQGNISEGFYDVQSQRESLVFCFIAHAGNARPVDNSMCHPLLLLLLLLFPPLPLVPFFFGLTTVIVKPFVRRFPGCFSSSN